MSTFFATMPLHDGDLQQEVQLLRRHLREDALLELEPQPRHREEHGGLRALQVGDEGVERLGEVDVRAADEATPHSMYARSKMCASGRYEIAAVACRQLDAARRCPSSARVMRRSCASRPWACPSSPTCRRSSPGRRRRGRRGPSSGSVFATIVVPRLARVFGASGKAMRGMPAGTPGSCCSQVSSLPTKSSLRVAVLEHEADGVRPLRREDGDRGAAGHPDRELGDEEVRAVLRQDRHLDRPAARPSARRCAAMRRASLITCDQV